MTRFRVSCAGSAGTANDVMPSDGSSLPSSSPNDIKHISLR